MSENIKEYRVLRSDAERVLKLHLASLGGQSRSNRLRNRGATRQILDDLCVVREQPPSEWLVINAATLVSWMIRDALGRPVGCVRDRMLAVGRYLRALKSGGLMPIDLMAEFKVRHGSRRWEAIVPALQASDPVAELALLQSEPVPCGPLEVWIRRYVELHQALGRGYGNQRSVLLHLDRFLHSRSIRSCPEITRDEIQLWSKTLSGNAATQRAKLRDARRFFSHLLSLNAVVSNPVCPVLYDAGRVPHCEFKPFIFSVEQITAVLAEARQLKTNRLFPLRRETCSTMLGLLYALGLRSGEVRRLRRRDVDLSGALLFIDQTKFHKSRYVPFGTKVGNSLKLFLESRSNLHPPFCDNDYLFVTLGPGPICKKNLQAVFHGLLAKLGIEGHSGRSAPRVHDLRHTFAVHRLLRWYREGVDVQRRLPALSTFMGHISPVSTQLYLTITTDLLKEANTRFEKHFGHSLDNEAKP